MGINTKFTFVMAHPFVDGISEECWVFRKSNSSYIVTYEEDGTEELWFKNSKSNTFSIVDHDTESLGISNFFDFGGLTVVCSDTGVKYVLNECGQRVNGDGSFYNVNGVYTYLPPSAVDYTPYRGFELA